MPWQPTGFDVYANCSGTSAGFTDLLRVSAIGQAAVSAQLSAGGLLSAWAVPAGQLSAWRMGVTGQEVVSAQLSAGGAVSAFTAGQAVSAFTAGQAISAFTTGQILSAWAIPAGVISSQAGTALSAQFPGQLGGQVTSSTPFTELTATSAVIPLSAGFRTFIYAWNVSQNQLVLSAARVNAWWKWQASGTAVADITGYVYRGQISAGVFTFQAGEDAEAVAPPGYIVVGPTNSAVALNISAVSAGFFSFGGFIAYFRAA